jgi:hypothetical protein
MSDNTDDMNDFVLLAMARDEAVSRVKELEAKLAKAVEALEWQADTIRNNITTNEADNHRLLIDGVYHEGPVVDWLHAVLTGLESINRAVLAKLKGENDDG